MCVAEPPGFPSPVGRFQTFPQSAQDLAIMVGVLSKAATLRGQRTFRGDNLPDGCKLPCHLSSSEHQGAEDQGDGDIPKLRSSPGPNSAKTDQHARDGHVQPVVVEITDVLDAPDTCITAHHKVQSADAKDNDQQGAKLDRHVAPSFPSVESADLWAGGMNDLAVDAAVVASVKLRNPRSGADAPGMALCEYKQ